MKLKILGTSVLAIATICAMVSCGGSSGNTDAVKKAIQEAQKMTYDQLVTKAKEEIGTNNLEVYGNSSALSNALKNFTNETNIQTKNNKLGDAALYEKLQYTIGLNRYAADMVLIQDGNKLQANMLANNFLLNFIPKDIKDVVADDDKDPMAAVYLNKVFMYNNTDFNGTTGTGNGKLTNHLTNVWQVAGTTSDTGHIANVSFKPASQENVNMNFLIMLTSPEWCAKLEMAYKDFYKKDYVKEEQYENIGYKFIAEFLKNCSWHDSDGTATKNAAKGNSGVTVLTNFNKLKDCTETGVGKTDAKNLTAAIIENETLKGFGGFVYKMYSMVPKNAKYPYAACALVNYILTKAGYEGAWGSNLGYYSTNKTITIADGDKELSWWKSHCVIEDPKYVAENYLELYEFITNFEK